MSSEQRQRELLEMTLDLLAQYAEVSGRKLEHLAVGKDGHYYGYKGLGELIALEIDADWEFGGDDE